MTFLGIEERWLVDPRWRCVYGHVSVRYLKSEELGADLCLACHKPVRLVQADEDLIELGWPSRKDFARMKLADVNEFLASQGVDWRVAE